MAQFFLLDTYNFTGSVNQLWKKDSPKIYPLFATTLLDHYKEEGPTFITGNIENLLHTCQTQPENWPGLLITSSATEQALLTYLRSLLFVTYPPESKGVLTYYDRHTATYLFNYTEKEQLSYWLGPIESMKWYGGTWQQQANNRLSWQEISQTIPINSNTLSPYSPLTIRQQQGLTLARQEKYAYDWSQNHDQAYDAIYQHLQEAIQLDFDELNYLDQYLTLRAKHPHQLTPVQLTGSNTAQRLANLENFWRTNGQV